MAPPRCRAAMPTWPSGASRHEPVRWSRRRRLATDPLGSRPISPRRARRRPDRNLYGFSRDTSPPTLSRSRSGPRRPGMSRFSKSVFVVQDQMGATPTTTAHPRLRDHAVASSLNLRSRAGEMASCGGAAALSEVELVQPTSTTRQSSGIVDGPPASCSAQGWGSAGPQPRARRGMARRFEPSIG